MPYIITGKEYADLLLEELQIDHTDLLLLDHLDCASILRVASFQDWIRKRRHERKVIGISPVENSTHTESKHGRKSSVGESKHGKTNMRVNPNTEIKSREGR
jgi:hypothetical protein